MHPTLFVIDEAFVTVVQDVYRATQLPFIDCRLVSISDTYANTTISMNWSKFVDQIVQEVRREPPSLLLVIGHMAIFKGHLPELEHHKPNCRVPAAEEELRNRLGASAPPVYVSGFHHDEHSDIYRVLFSEKVLERPGSFAELRRAVEDGGGPVVRLSILKHDLMRPFASVRLILQLEADEEHGGLDESVVKRISSAVDSARVRMRTLEEAAKDALPPYVDAVSYARKLFDTDVKEITANPESFNGWIDRVNHALDEIREVAR